MLPGKWDFMNGGDPENPSETAAGDCFRLAAAAFEEFESVRARSQSSGQDRDLDKVGAVWVHYNSCRHGLRSHS